MNADKFLQLLSVNTAISFWSHICSPRYNQERDTRDNITDSVPKPPSPLKGCLGVMYNFFGVFSVFLYNYFRFISHVPTLQAYPIWKTVVQYVEKSGKQRLFYPGFERKNTFFSLKFQNCTLLWLSQDP